MAQQTQAAANGTSRQDNERTFGGFLMVIEADNSL
tara:strand:- start:203 stop:307 length:105 start_codon:yes stop_codon:yes gene_type:complete